MGPFLGQPERGVVGAGGGRRIPLLEFGEKINAVSGLLRLYAREIR